MTKPDYIPASLINESGLSSRATIKMYEELEKGPLSFSEIYSRLPLNSPAQLVSRLDRGKKFHLVEECDKKFIITPYGSKCFSVAKELEQLLAESSKVGLEPK